MDLGLDMTTAVGGWTVHRGHSGVLYLGIWGSMTLRPPRHRYRDKATREQTTSQWFFEYSEPIKMINSQNQIATLSFKMS